MKSSPTSLQNLAMMTVLLQEWMVYFISTWRSHGDLFIPTSYLLQCEVKVHSSPKETQVESSHFSRWSWVTDPDPVSCKWYMMLGSLIYTLPQKKWNLQAPAFLLGKSVAVLCKVSHDVIMKISDKDQLKCWYKNSCFPIGALQQSQYQWKKTFSYPKNDGNSL